MGINKRLFTKGASGGDPRTAGSPSAATAKWVIGTGNDGKLYYHASANPNNTFSNVTLGSATSIYDAQWDGFTWIATTDVGVFQTKDSSCATGWTQVVSGNTFNRIVPVPGGNLCFNNGGPVGSGRGQVAYTSVINPSSVSSGDWSTKATPSIGQNYIMDATVGPNNVVIGRRLDSGSNTAFFYSDDDDWFLDNNLTTWSISASPPWGASITTDGNDKWTGSRRSAGGFYATSLGGSETNNQLYGFNYTHQTSYANGYWLAADSKTEYAYKTSHTGAYNSNSSLGTKPRNKFYYNGTYWTVGCNYDGANSKAAIYMSSFGTHNFISQGTIGSASGGYIHFFKGSVVQEVGAWTDLGSASPTFG